MSIKMLLINGRGLTYDLGNDKGYGYTDLHFSHNSHGDHKLYIIKGKHTNSIGRSHLEYIISELNIDRAHL